MKFTKKLIALMLGVLMVIGFIPIAGIAETNASTRKILPMSEAERQVKLKELDEWADKLYKMTQEYGVKPTKKAAEDDPYALARIIVKSARKLDYKGSAAHINGHNDLHIIQYKTPAEAKEAAAKYRSMKYVEYAEPDIIMRADMTAHTDEFLSWGFGANYVKTFEYSENQLNGGDGSNLPQIVVAVIDTGIDFNHPYFGGMVADGGRILPNGKDYIDNDDTPQDGAGHGSHVAGTICDGTLPNVKILPIRVLGDDGSGSSTGVANGMEYAYLQGADIANMSLGGSGQDTNEKNIVDTGTERGTLYCVAAGNEGNDASNHSPAYVPNAFTVAACGIDKQMASFSNFGTCVDITAPGVAIKSVKLGGGWTGMDGTSMATPHTAAAAAMVKTFNKNFTPQQIGDWLKNMADKSIDYPKGGGSGFLRLCDSANTPPPTEAPPPVNGINGFYFETNPIEEGWTWQDKDGDGNNWDWWQQTYDGDTPAYNIPEGSGCMAAMSNGLTPENWLISPKVGGGGYMTFLLGGQDPRYSAERIDVYVSTNGGSSWSDVLGSFTGKGEVTTCMVDLTAYAGQKLNIAFKHCTSPAQFWVLLDKVIVADNTVPTPPPEQEEVWQLADTIEAGKEYIIVAGGKGKAIKFGKGIIPGAADVTENSNNTINVRRSVVDDLKWIAGGSASALSLKNGSSYLALVVGQQQDGWSTTYFSRLEISKNSFSWTYANNDLKGTTKEGTSNKTYYVTYPPDRTSFNQTTTSGNNIKFYGRPSATYTVTWKNWNGTVLETDEGVFEGSMPEYNGETPRREAPDSVNEVYVFDGWDPEPVAVTQDAVYTAKFKLIPCFAVTWKNWDGKTLETDPKIPQGTMPEYNGDTPEKTEPAPKAGHYWKFSGWDPEPVAVTQDITYTAQFTEEPIEYTITWKNYDNTVLKTDLVPYGTTPAYTGATPVKPADENYVYTFAGWDPEIVPVTGDAVYTAVFTQAEKPPVPEGKEVWKRVNQPVAGKTYLIVAGNNWKAVKNNNGTVAAEAVERFNDSDEYVTIAENCTGAQWVCAAGWNFKNGSNYLAINLSGSSWNQTASLGTATSKFDWTYANNDLSAKVNLGLIGGDKTYNLTYSGSNFTITDTANQNIRFYEKAYVVSYLDGGTRVATEYRTEGEQFQIHAALTKEGYAFTGWLCDKDNQTYQPGADYTTPAGDVTFTAQWDAVTPTKEVWQLTDTLEAGETYIIVAGGLNQAVSNEYALNGKNLKPVGVTENSDNTLTVPDTADLNKITWKAGSGSGNFSLQSVGNNKYLGLTGFYIYYALALEDEARYWNYTDADLSAVKDSSNAEYLAYNTDRDYFVTKGSSGNNIRFYHKVTVPVESPAAGNNAVGPAFALPPAPVGFSDRRFLYQ